MINLILIYPLVRWFESPLLVMSASPWSIVTQNDEFQVRQFCFFFFF